MTHRIAENRRKGERGRGSSFASCFPPRFRVPALALVLLLCCAPPGQAQPTNLDAYQRLALRCLALPADTARALLLEAPAQMPYLRTALTQRWQQEGRVVFLADASLRPAGPLPPRLEFAVEEAYVTYARVDGKRLRRTVTLALRYALTAADGRLLREDRCRDTFTDTLPASAVSTIESQTFSETQAPLPEGSWLRRYLEPAVLLLATATGVYLFFSLRSND